jgi:hypothetical protein
MKRHDDEVRLPGVINAISDACAGVGARRERMTGSAVTWRRRTAVSQPQGHRPNRVNAAALLWLNSRPRWLLGVILIAVALGGLLIPGLVGTLLLLVLAALLAWLAAMSWPRVDAAGRLLRVLVVALIVGSAILPLNRT